MKVSKSDSPIKYDTSRSFTGTGYPIPKSNEKWDNSYVLYKPVTILEKNA